MVAGDAADLGWRQIGVCHHAGHWSISSFYLNIPLSHHPHITRATPAPQTTPLSKQALAPQMLLRERALETRAAPSDRHPTQAKQGLGFRV